MLSGGFRSRSILYLIQDSSPRKASFQNDNVAVCS